MVYKVKCAGHLSVIHLPYRHGRRPSSYISRGVKPPNPILDTPLSISQLIHDDVRVQFNSSTYRRHRRRRDTETSTVQYSIDRRTRFNF